MKNHHMNRSTLYVSLLTFTCSCFLFFNTPYTQPFLTRGTIGKPADHQPTRGLSKPPELSNLLPRIHTNGRARYVPTQHDQPFVYAASAFLRVNKEGKDELPLLFLYSQGTSVLGGNNGRLISLNITSCVISGERHPILYRSTGVYACYMKRKLRLGDQLSLVLSPSIFMEEVDSRHLSRVTGYVQHMRKMKDGSYVLPTDAFWEGQIDPPIQSGEGRYEVCLMTQEKLFTEYLSEWVEYHRKLGVDHVYIYDNNASGNLSKVFENRDDIEVVYWPWYRSQIQAQNHFILNGRRRCQWGILIDVDEYVMVQPLNTNNEESALKSYLRSIQKETNYSQVRLSSTVLGSSGHKFRPRVPVAEAYWHFAEKQDNLTKPIVLLGHAFPDSLVHFVFLPKGYWTLWRSEDYHTKAGVEMKIVHMKFRAWSDYLVKGRGGRNSMAVNVWEISPKWTIENPSPKHLRKSNRDSFTLFRSIWRRVVSQCADEEKLIRFDEKERWHDGGKCSAHYKAHRYGFNANLVLNHIIC